MRRVAHPAMAVAALCAVALSGCAPAADSGAAGGGGQAVTGSSQPEDATSNESEQQPPAITSPAPAGSAVPAQLTVTVDEGSGTVATYTLTCEPVRGDHPDPAAACAALAAAGADVFAPPDPNQACTEIYGGPQTATVTGTVAGTQVNSTFSRENGCQIARWEAMAAVFASAGGA